VAGISEAKWLKVNSGQTGFYRVLYSEDLMRNLGEAISSLKLAPEDRLGVQNDAFAMAQAGLLSTVQALELTKNYKNEVEESVWADLNSNLGELSICWSGQDNYDQLKKFTCDLLRPIFDKLGWEQKPEQPETWALLRPSVITKLGLSGDKAVVAKLKEMYESYKKSADSVAPALRSPMLLVAVAEGDAKVYDEVLEMYKTADLPEFKINTLKALGFSRDTALLTRTLEMGLDEKIVKPQDTMYCFAYVAMNRHGRELAWKFLQDNWEKIMKQFGDGQFILGRLISYCTKYFTSEEKAKEVEKFFADKDLPSAARTIKQSLESIHSYAAWLARDKEAVAKFLTEQK